MFDQKRFITIVLVSMKTKTNKKNIFFSKQPPVEKCHDFGTE
jgi:hypothetical protein